MFQSLIHSQTTDDDRIHTKPERQQFTVPDREDISKRGKVDQKTSSRPHKYICIVGK